MTRNEKYFTIQPTQGLGNRWRSIVSSYVIAEYLQLPLYIYWSPSVGFDDTQLHELIDIDHLIKSSDLPVKLISRDEYDDMYSHGFILCDHFDKVSVERDDITSFRQREDAYIKFGYVDQILNSKSISKICTEINMNLVYAFFEQCVVEHIPEFWARYEDCASKFILPKSLRDNFIISQMEHQVRECFGVHIRRGDSITLNNPYRDKYSIDIDKYYTVIDKLLNQYDQFMLSTDCVIAHNHIVSRYGDAVLYYKKSFVESNWNERKTGITDARVEQHLLGQTKHLVRSEWSSFAEPIYTTKPNNIKTTIIK